MIAESDLRTLAHSAGLANAAVHLWRLGASGAQVALDDGRSIYPASMMKTPLAVAVACAVAAGRLHWETEFTIDEANMTANDAPSPCVPGARATTTQLVELMLGHSDNVATNVLIDGVRRERANADLTGLGFHSTTIARKLSGSLPLIDDPSALGRNRHSASDACELFARIERDDVPGAAIISHALTGQYWNTKLSRGLMPGDRFAHKTGDTDEVSHDGGILWLASGERYALAVYTTLAATETTDLRFGAFMLGLRPFLLRPKHRSSVVRNTQ